MSEVARLTNRFCFPDTGIRHSDISITKEEKRHMRYMIPVGRILFALIFISAAPRHFTHEGIQHATDLGVPAASLLVPISGILALLGGLSVATGFKSQWGAWMLIAFLVPVTFGMHGFWRLQDAKSIHIQQAMFWKNVSMFGAALILTQLKSGW
jgi:putative oxidoreductase